MNSTPTHESYTTSVAMSDNEENDYSESSNCSTPVSFRTRAAFYQQLQRDITEIRVLPERYEVVLQPETPLRFSVEQIRTIVEDRSTISSRWGLCCCPFGGLPSVAASIKQHLRDFANKFSLPRSFEAQALTDWVPSLPLKVELGDESATLLKDLTATLEGLNIGSTIQETKESITDAVDTLKQLTIGLLIVSSGYMAMKSDNRAWVGAFTLATLIGGYALRDHVRQCVNDLTEKIQKWTSSGAGGETFTAQNLEDYSSEFVTMAAALFLGIVVAKTPSSRMMAAIVPAIISFPKVVDGIMPVIVAVVDLLIKVINNLKTWITGNEAPLMSFHIDDDEVDDWCNAVISMRAAFGTDQFLYTVETQEACEKLILEGMELLKKDIKGPAGYKLRRVVSEYMRTLKTMLDKIKTMSPDREGFRPQPVAVYFTGAPGVGKTWLVQQLAAEILAEVLEEWQLEKLKKDWKSFIYMRTPENEYWEKYEGQPITICDDAFQMRDVPGGNVQEYMEAIRMLNNFPYCLHMADIESKGNVYFKSRIVFFTSNLEEPRSNTIHSDEAFYRRLDIRVKTVPAEEFSVAYDGVVPNEDNRRLDKRKCGRRFNRDVYRFKERHSVRTPSGLSATVPGETLDYYSLKERIVSLFRERSESADIYQSCLEQGVAEAIRDRMASRGSSEPDDQYEDSTDSSSESSECSDSSDDREPLDRFEVNGRGSKQQDIFTAQVGESGSVELIDDMTLYNPYAPLSHFTLRVRKHVKALGPWGEDFVKTHPFLTTLRMIIDPSQELPMYAWIYYLLQASRENGMNFYNLHSLMTNIVDSHINEDLRFHPQDVIFTDASHRDKAIAFGVSMDRLYHEYQIDLLRKSKWSLFRELRIARHKFGEWISQHPILRMCSVFLLAFIAIKGVLSGVSYLADRALEKTKSTVKSLFLQKNEEGVFEAQSGEDKNCADVAAKMCQRSFYHFRFNDGGPVAGHCIVVSGRLALLPLHYKTVMETYVKAGKYDSDPYFTLESKQTQKIYRLHIDVLLKAKVHNELESRDACMIELPVNFHPHVSLLKNWVTREMKLEKFPNLSISLWKPVGDTMGAFISEAVHRTTTKVQLVSGGGYSVQEAFQYRQIQTQLGDCGSPVLVYNNHIGPGKIIGFHIAGDPVLGGLCNILYRDILEKCMESYDYKPRIAMPDLEDEEEMDVNPLDVHTNYSAQFSAPYSVPATPYGEVARGPFQSTDTKIRTSPLFGMFGPAKTEPADLKNKEYRKAAIIKFYRTPVMEVGIAEWQKCAFVLGKHLLSQSKTRRAALVFPFAEACVGIPALPYCNALPRNTSPGFPYNVRPVAGYPGKTRFFGRGEEYDLESSEAIKLRERTERIIELAKQGKRCVHIYSDTMKDERLPKGKGKIRAFSASAVDTTIVMRQYFMDCVQWAFENHVHNGMAPGLNVFTGWPMLVNKLKRFTKCVAGDYSGFDSRHTPEVMEQVLIIIEMFYQGSSTEEDIKVRRVFFEEILHSVHILGNKVYQWEGSLPSGAFLTTFINCICNLMYLMMCYVHVVPGSNFEEFFEHVSAVVYGDDNVMSISDDKIEMFNGQSIQKFMPRVNQEYTAEDKSPVMYKYRSLGEVTFLKRSMRYEPRFDTWVAPLSLDTILESPYWYRDTAVPMETIESNVDNLFLEGSLHGEDKFHELQGHVTEIRNRIGYCSPWSFSWERTFEYMLTREDFI